MPQPSCPKCHALQSRRIKQKGFIQQNFLCRLGYYPWECRFCKATFVLKDRGLRKPGDRREPQTLTGDLQRDSMSGD